MRISTVRDTGPCLPPFLSILGMLFCSAPVFSQDDPGRIAAAPENVQAVLATHCVECRGSGAAEGEVRFDRNASLQRGANLELLNKAQEQPFFGLMPPEDAHTEKWWKCHKQMNPLGLPFEVFDDFGRFRVEESLEHPENLISIDADRASVESGGSFKAVIVSLLTSDSFMYRKDGQTQPDSASAAQLMVDSGFESLAVGDRRETGKVQRGWEVQRHGRDSIRRALKVEALEGDNLAKSGRRYLALSIPQNTVGFEYVTIGQRHRLKAGAEYEASVWVRWPAGPDEPPAAKGRTQPASAIVSFWVRDRDGEGHFAGRDVWLTDNRWKKLKFRFRPTESALPSLVYLSLLPHQKPVATTLLVDDFQLTETAASAEVDTRREQLVLDSDFSKQSKRTISPPWYFANRNGAGIPGVVESEAGNRFVRLSMGDKTSNFESAQLWQHVHLIEGATYEIRCSMRWDNFAKDADAPIINYGIYHDKSNTWYGPVDQILKKTGDWRTYRFMHTPTESGPWKLYVQVNGWGNFGNGVTVSVDDIHCQQRAGK